MNNHTLYKCPDDCNGCQFCEGGLASCTTCKGGEGSLPTVCPGRPMTEQKPLVGSNRQDRKTVIDVNDGLVNTPYQTVNKE